MVATPTEANWPVTYPGNLRWSNATQIVKGMVAYGAAAMAEIDLITQRLKARAAEADLDKAWMEEWSKEADRVAKRHHDRKLFACAQWAWQALT